MTEDDDNAFRIGNLMIKMDGNALDAGDPYLAEDDLELLPQVAELTDNPLFTQKLLTSLGHTDIEGTTGGHSKQENVENMNDLTLNEIPAHTESLLNDTNFTNSLHWVGLAGMEDEKLSLGSDSLDFLQGRIDNSSNSVFNLDDTNGFPPELFNMKLENDLKLSENYQNFFQFDLVKDLCDFTKQSSKNNPDDENYGDQRLSMEGDNASSSCNSDVKIELSMEDKNLEGETQSSSRRLPPSPFVALKNLKKMTLNANKPIYPRRIKSEKMEGDDDDEDDEQKSRVRPVIHRRCKSSIKSGKSRSYLPRSDRNTTFACQKCDYSTTNRSNFKNHQLIHGEERMFQCPYCPYRSKQSAGLRAHYKVHSIEKPFQCSFCSYKSKRKQNLVQHLRIHSKERPFRCEQCSYRATTKQLLQNHLLWHVSIRNKNENPSKYPNNDALECLVCNISFSSESELSLHFQTHSDENVVSSTQENETLNKEIRRHLTTANLAFKCSKCDFVTLRKCALRNHIKSHNNKDAYKCSVCEFRSTSASTMAVHVDGHKQDGPVCSSTEWSAENPNNDNSEMIFDRDITDTPAQSPSDSFIASDDKQTYQCPYCDFECELGEVLKVHICNHPNDFLLGFRKRPMSESDSFEMGSSASPEITNSYKKPQKIGEMSHIPQMKSGSTMSTTGKTIVYPEKRFKKTEVISPTYNFGSWTNVKYSPWSSSSGKIHIAPNFNGKCFTSSPTTLKVQPSPVWTNADCADIDQNRNLSTNSTRQNDLKSSLREDLQSNSPHFSGKTVYLTDHNKTVSDEVHNDNEQFPGDMNTESASNCVESGQFENNTSKNLELSDSPIIGAPNFASAIETVSKAPPEIPERSNEHASETESGRSPVAVTENNNNENNEETSINIETVIDFSSEGPSSPSQASLYSGSSGRSESNLLLTGSPEHIQEAPEETEENTDRSVPKKFLCKECNTCFPKKSSLTNHSRVHSNKMFRCPLCAYTSKFLKTFLKHTKKHTHQKEFSCSECNFTTDKKNTLVIHYRTHKHAYTCSHCGFTCKFIKDLEVHSMVHPDGMSIKCSSCDFVSCKFKLLRLHIKKYHTKSLYNCVKCSVGFQDVNMFHDHLEMHFNGEESSTTECSKSSQDAGNSTSKQSARIIGGYDSDASISLESPRGLQSIEEERKPVCSDKSQNSKEKQNSSGATIPSVLERSEVQLESSIEKNQSTYLGTNEITLKSEIEIFSE